MLRDLTPHAFANSLAVHILTIPLGLVPEAKCPFKIEPKLLIKIIAFAELSYYNKYGFFQSIDYGLIMSGLTKIEEEDLPAEIADGFTGVSILSRLEFVSNIVCAHTVNIDDPLQESVQLKVADKVLADVIRILRGYPEAARLSQPNPS